MILFFLIFTSSVLAIDQKLLSLNNIKVYENEMEYHSENYRFYHQISVFVPTLDLITNDEYKFLNELDNLKLDYEIQINLVSFDKCYHVCNLYNIEQSMTSLYLIQKQHKRQYDTYRFSVDQFQMWLDQQVKKEMKLLGNYQEFVKFMDQNYHIKLVALLEDENSQEKHVLDQLLKENFFQDHATDCFNIAYILDISLIEQDYEITKTHKKNNFFLFKKRNKDHSMNSYDGDLTSKIDIQNFYIQESIPLVTIQNLNHEQLVFNHNFHGSIHLLIDIKQDNTNVLKEFEKAAFFNKQNRQQRILFAVCDINQNNFTSPELSQFYQAAIKHIPNLILFGFEQIDDEQYMTRYIYNEHMMHESISKWIQSNLNSLNQQHLKDFHDKKLREFKISEKLDKSVVNTVDSDYPSLQYKTLVGSNYEEEVLVSGMRQGFNSVVNFCYGKNQCDEFSKILRQLIVVNSRLSQDVDQVLNLKFFNIDSSKNEIFFPQIYQTQELHLIMQGHHTVKYEKLEDTDVNDISLWIVNNILDFYQNMNVTSEMINKEDDDQDEQQQKTEL